MLSPHIYEICINHLISLAARTQIRSQDNFSHAHTKCNASAPVPRWWLWHPCVKSKAWKKKTKYKLPGLQTFEATQVFFFLTESWKAFFFSPAFTSCTDVWLVWGLFLAPNTHRWWNQRGRKLSMGSSPSYPLNHTQDKHPLLCKPAAERDSV